MKVLTVVLSIFLGACVKPPTSWKEYDAIHQHAAIELPWAVRVEKKFPGTDHFITHFGMENSKPTWNTVSYFGNRYEFTVQVDIVIDYKNKSFKATGPVKAYLTEVLSVKPNGAAKHGDDIHIGTDDFETLVDSDLDFSQIGVLLNPTPVKNFSLFEQAWRKPRRPVTLAK
jgi:hypothetical protein